MYDRSSALRVPKNAAAYVTPLAVAFGVLGFGCGPGAPSHGAAQDQAEPVTVRAILAVDASAFGGLILPGRVKAREEITLASRITGRLTTLPLREGSPFKRGQVLARFDAPETREAVRSAREALASTRAGLDQALADEARMTTLLAQNVAAARDLELARVARHAAEAALSNAQAELERWNENAALTAPFEGVVARRHVDPGQTLMPGQPILDLRSRAVGEIEAAVPESALPDLDGASAAYQIADGPWNAASIVRVDGMTDPATRTRLAAFRPLERASLEAGTYARVRIQTHAAGRDSDATSQPVIVPSRSLVHRGALTGVYVLRDERAWLRWLRVGRESDGQIEVLSGLTSGDRIAAEPDGLSDGCAVRIAE